METNFYLGKWVNNDPKKSEDMVLNCIDTDASKSEAIFDNNLRISFQDLDLSGKYEKILPIYECEEVKQNLGPMSQSLSSRVVPSAILGDLSKIGHGEKPSINEVLRETNIESLIIKTSEINEPKEIAYTTEDPVTSFIHSAIQMSCKRGKKTKLPITIVLDIDFDIVSVIETAMKLGASDVEILQRMMKFININVDDVKHSISKELLKTPEDIELVETDREIVFDRTLNDEIQRSSKTPELERYVDKDVE